MVVVFHCKSNSFKLFCCLWKVLRKEEKTLALQGMYQNQEIPNKWINTH